jgi:endonuclease YncB( thermonuclease family)
MITPHRIPLLLLLFVLATASTRTNGGTELVGEATVIDGDTIALAGEHVRLYGIDAPELRQSCRVLGQEWPCGRMAKDWLTELLAGREVACSGRGPPARWTDPAASGRARDRYGRLLAVCRVGGEDLNERIVRAGWALAYRKYSSDYVDAEAQARAAGSGVWRGSFMPPWDWRAAQESDRFAGARP